MDISMPAEESRELEMTNIDLRHRHRSSMRFSGGLGSWVVRRCSPARARRPEKSTITTSWVWKPWYPWTHRGFPRRQSSDPSDSFLL